MVWAGDQLKILEVLESGRTMYGLEMTREVGIKPSSIYTVLECMEQKGFIQCVAYFWNPCVDRKRRGMYKITNKGAIVLKYVRVALRCGDVT